MRKYYRGVIVWMVCFAVTSLAFGGTISARRAIRTRLDPAFTLYTPEPGETVSGIVGVQGRITDAQNVSRITLVIDGLPVHDADLNVPRSDPRWTYPGFEGEPLTVYPGFITSFVASYFEDGEHVIAFRVTTSGGETMVLGERTIIVDNSLNQAPIGNIDSPRDPAEVGMTDVVSGVFPIVGWAVDADGIRQRVSPAGCTVDVDPDCHVLADIDVMVDGTVVGQSMYALPRPDVAIAFPDLADGMDSGFQMNLDTTRYSNGPHTISARAWDDEGGSRVIAERQVWIDNNYATLKPVGAIDWPMSNGHLFSTSCQFATPSGVEYETGHRIEWVSGWVVDQNDQARFEGVKYVELLLDGVLLKRTSTDCGYLSAFGMDVNCYGLYQRPDVLYRYPQFPSDAKYSGYFFALDMDYLLGEPPDGIGLHKGLHYLAIRVGTQDPTRPAEIIDQIPVILECNERMGHPAFGELEVPEAMQDMSGIELVEGWIVDFDQVRRLNFYVDGVLDGSLIRPDDNMFLSRPDVVERYPFYPQQLLLNSGFRYSLDTSKYVDGVHSLVIEVEDMGFNSNYWVQRMVRFDNPN